MEGGCWMQPQFSCQDKGWLQEITQQIYTTILEKGRLIQKAELRLRGQSWLPWRIVPRFWSPTTTTTTKSQSAHVNLRTVMDSGTVMDRDSFLTFHPAVSLLDQNVCNSYPRCVPQFYAGNVWNSLFSFIVLQVHGIRDTQEPHLYLM